MQITVLELLVKGIPEGFLDVLSIYLFTRTKIEFKNYLFQSIITVLMIYSIRQLPINYGVNSMLSLILFSILFSIIYKMQFFKVIKAAIITVIIIFISEVINVNLLNMIYGSDMTQQLLNDPFTRCIYSIPSTLLFAATLFVSRLILKKTDKSGIKTNGENRPKISSKNM